VGRFEGRPLIKLYLGYNKFLPLTAAGQDVPKVLVYVARGVTVIQRDLPGVIVVCVMIRGVRVYNVYRESRDIVTLPLVLAAATGRGK